MRGSHDYDKTLSGGALGPACQVRPPGSLQLLRSQETSGPASVTECHAMNTEHCCDCGTCREHNGDSGSGDNGAV